MRNKINFIYLTIALVMIGSIFFKGPYFFLSYYIHASLVILFVAVIATWKKAQNSYNERSKKMYAEMALVSSRKVNGSVCLEAALDIAEYISDGDREILEKISLSINDHLAYYDNYASLYERQRISYGVYKNRTDITWFCLIYNLIKKEYAVEINWEGNCDSESIFSNLEKLTSKYGLNLAEKKQFQTSKINLKGHILDFISSELAQKNLVLGSIVTNVGADVYFILNKGYAENLIFLAQKFNHPIFSIYFL